MKVFISWSGEISRLVANALRDWLPNVIQAVDPWMSSSDIDKGARWSTEISTQLAESSFGIICLTPENLKSPWILFEAGALSKTIENTLVCPYLFQVEPRDVEWPLAQFQLTKAEMKDTLQLIHTINVAQGNKESLPESRIDVAFKRWWPILEQDLTSIPKGNDELENIRPDREILNEILELVRETSREKIVTLRETVNLGGKASNEIQSNAEDAPSRKKGVFIGAYIRNDLKGLLRQRASLNQRTLSQEISRILADSVDTNSEPAL